MENLLRNGANINEKDVRINSFGETDDFETERETETKRGRKKMRGSESEWALWGLKRVQ